MNQTAFQFPASAHRKVRMRRAVECTEHADAVEPRWSEKAYAFLVEYSQSHNYFLIEEVVHASRGHVPDPTDPRAWGSVVRRAQNNGRIRHSGNYSRHTKNACPKILWERT